jgi:peptidyl-prolyl cis-trans isomerase SurA
VRKRLALIATLLAALLGGAACKQPAPPSAGVWAVVNGKEITREEVEKYYRSRVNPEGQEPSHEEALSLKLNILDELISNEILLERARKLGLEASDGEVEDKFTELKAPFTEDEFQRQMKERNVTVDDLKRDLRRQLSIQKLLNREVVAKVSITDQDVADFYEQNRPQFNVVETQYRVAQIAVTARRDPQVRNRKSDDAGTDAEARRKAQALLERVHAGADFAQVAMDYSEDPVTSVNGGDLGFIPESALNQTDPALKRALTTLRPGEISSVIAVPGGYRVLKLIAKESPGQRELADPRVQQSIRDTLRNRKEQLLRAAYLTRVRDEAKVVNYLAGQVLESAGKLPAAAAAPKQETPSPPAKSQ